MTRLGATKPALPPASPERYWPKGVMSIMLLAFLGIVVSAYLIWVHYSRSQAFCAGVGDCDFVNASPYAQVMGIPVALLGLGGYVLISGLGLARWRAGPLMLTDLTLFGVTLAGTVYSAYLTYIELFVLHAICIWCVFSALIMASIFILSLATITRG